MALYNFNYHASVASSNTSSDGSYDGNNLLEVKGFAITFDLVDTNHAYDRFYH